MLERLLPSGKAQWGIHAVGLVIVSLDVDGRVVHLDSFSKFIASGSKCSWITGLKELVTAVMVKAKASTVSVKLYDLSTRTSI